MKKRAVSIDCALELKTMPPDYAVRRNVCVRLADGNIAVTPPPAWIMKL